MTIQEALISVEDVKLRERLLHLAGESHYDNLEKNVMNIYSALQYAFDWSDTTEGEDYWHDIYTEYKEKEEEF